MKKISEIEKKRNKEFNKWFRKLSLKDKVMLKDYLEFIKGVKK